MGYTHYWYRPLKISTHKFEAILQDFKKLVPVLEKAGVKLAGPLGEGKPKINSNIVAFNGAINCGHPKGYELAIPWPAPNAGGVFAGNAVAGSWFAGTLLNTRYCPGDCSYESFVFPRIFEPEEWEKPNEKKLWFDFCKTAFRPYDLAVTAFLVIAKHHLKHRIVVTTDGEEPHWFDAKMLCATELGYGLDLCVRHGELVKMPRVYNKKRD